MAMKPSVFPTSDKTQEQRDKLAAEFRAWLNQRELSCYALAKRIAIPARRIEDWVNGTHRVPILLPVVLRLLDQIDGRMVPDEAP